MTWIGFNSKTYAKSPDGPSFARIKPNSTSRFILPFHVASARGPPNPDSNANSRGFRISRKASSKTQHQRVRYVSERGNPLSESTFRILPIRGIVRGMVVNPTRLVLSQSFDSGTSGHIRSRRYRRFSPAFLGTFFAAVTTVFSLGFRCLVQSAPIFLNFTATIDVNTSRSHATYVACTVFKNKGLRDCTCSLYPVPVVIQGIRSPVERGLLEKLEV